MKQYRKLALSSLLLISFLANAAPVKQGMAKFVKNLNSNSMPRQTACSSSVDAFRNKMETDQDVIKSMQLALANVQDLPKNYGGFDGFNPWDQGWPEFVIFFTGIFSYWCEVLPVIAGSHDNGLVFIQLFAMFYYQNQAAVDFVQGRNPEDPTQAQTDLADFLHSFISERGAYMDSSASTLLIGLWISDPRVEIGDYIHVNPSDYSSWNDFFIRELKRVNPADPSSDIIARPVTMSNYPERDYIIVAPTDCIMNPLEQVVESDPALGVIEKVFIENPIDFNTVVNVKENPINVNDLLGSVSTDVKEKFVGGTGLSCVLMPNTYHHYHSPVSGDVIHAEVVKTSGVFGYDDFPNWAAQDGNAGRPGTDFSQFQAFQRGVIIVRLQYKDYNGAEVTGYVASVPVGLNTVGSVVLDDYILNASESNPVAVKAGNSRFGHFLYGGSLNILLFSKGLVQSSAIQTRLGNQIGLIDTTNQTPAAYHPSTAPQKEAAVENNKDADMEIKR